MVQKGHGRILVDIKGKFPWTKWVNFALSRIPKEYSKTVQSVGTLHVHHGLGTPRESFFFKFETFGLEPINWALIF